VGGSHRDSLLKLKVDVDIDLRGIMIYHSNDTNILKTLALVLALSTYSLEIVR